MNELKDKVVIVTGAGSGIGRAAALAFAAEGASVTVADINFENAQQTAATIGEQALALSVDVSSMTSTQEMVDKTVEHFGKLDVIFNNAGIGGKRALLADQSVENWQQVLNVNLNGVFYGSKAAIPHLQKNGGGVIINTASANGLSPMATMGPYNTSKHAVLGLTKTVALEYGKDNIRSVAICPGLTYTQMASGGDWASKDEVKAFATLSPLQRGADPEEIANLVVWLASDKASYVTGSHHQIDGGMLAGFNMG